ncbi:hypothetical protein NST84_05555 [Paenibacillus sp. FSL R7-0345]|uniref:hypothetical protein n=1 Tax=Paenibacillus sp. FSL R7-0345 TaxID=2954535 RepID=UPI00315A1FDD
MHTGKKTSKLAQAAAAFVLLAACSNTPAAEPEATATPVQTEQPAASPVPSQPPEPSAEPSASASPAAVPDEGTPPTALEAASTVMNALKNGNMETLSAWVSRDHGVRFSPYGYVDTENDLVFTQEEISGLMKDSEQRLWGSFQGSGEPINLTFAEYFERFVYDADFADDAQISLNTAENKGTMINNIKEVYPADKYDYVDYHISSIDPQYQGMDWRSLRLVFEKIGEDRILVGIVHDEWTP